LTPSRPVHTFVGRGPPIPLEHDLEKWIPVFGQDPAQT
jgi:hypothetical protein